MTKYDYNHLLSRVPVDVVMFDIEWMGGLTEAGKVTAMAEANQVPFAPHNCGGPVLHFANLHLGAAAPNPSDHGVRPGSLQRVAPRTRDDACRGRGRPPPAPRGSRPRDRTRRLGAGGRRRRTPRDRGVTTRRRSRRSRRRR
ncbi:hypothetical protein HUG10_07105 [Halorarum halophilum]|uniref:Enolase C-terminal domain-containing protein n=1 Tax=Halorarum halophilum TaxID=2743090 RepID=A0A7D5GWY8_9EURY|nr:hypothetical protein HUG10_07105 [Halobaculum halophilum]